ncbi:hypothetical protein [Mesorhizobium sp. RIZ17]|uniref:hypothetical protein n=1 Tax=Mesorhizobium sp. RIZ17 TaxID=3132743 RepID=UPI003DA9608C
MAKYLKKRGNRGIWYFQRAIPPELKGKKAEPAKSSPFNLPSDVGNNFDLDGERLWNTGLSPAIKLAMKERFDLTAAERKRRALGERPEISDDVFFCELAALSHVANDYSQKIINRILTSAGRV